MPELVFLKEAGLSPTASPPFRSPRGEPAADDIWMEIAMARLQAEMQASLKSHHMALEELSTKYDRAIEKLTLQQQQLEGSVRRLCLLRRAPSMSSANHNGHSVGHTSFVAPSAMDCAVAQRNFKVRANSTSQMSDYDAQSAISSSGNSARVVPRRTFGSRFMLDGSLYEARLDRRSGIMNIESEEPDSTEAEVTRFGKMRMLVQAIVNHALFDLICGIVILSNTVVIGIETEYLMTHDSTTSDLGHAQLIMNIWYIVELVFRIVAEGHEFVCDFRNLPWNMFDVILAVLSILDITVDTTFTGGLQVGRLLKTVRLLRIVRTLRVFRMLRHLSEFKRLLFLIYGSIQTMLWSIVLVFSILYIFAIWLCQTIILLGGEEGADIMPDDVRYFFSGLWRAILTLFQCMKDGLNWHYVMEPLLHLHWSLAVIFLIFIYMANIMVLNIISAVFVEGVVHSTQRYRDLMVQEQQKRRENYMQHMRHIFMQIDTDGSGEISMEEMDRFLRDETLQLQSYFDALDINASEATVLFKLLDVDGSGRIDIEEFCSGCLRLKGTATSFDINCMMYENRRVTQKFTEFMKFVEERFETMETHVKTIDKRQRKILDSAFTTESVILSSPSVRAALSEPNLAKPTLLPIDGAAIGPRTIVPAHAKNLKPSGDEDGVFDFTNGDEEPRDPEATS